MSSKNCIIKVGDDQNLSAVTQKILFGMGFKWSHLHNKETQPVQDISYYGQNASILIKDRSLFYESAEGLRSPYNSFPFFNAATEFGKLIAFLNAPVIPNRPTIEIKNIPDSDYKEVILCVSPQELKAIKFITQKTGGSPKGPRGFIDKICMALGKVKVAPDVRFDGIESGIRFPSTWDEFNRAVQIQLD